MTKGKRKAEGRRLLRRIAKGFSTNVKNCGYGFSSVARKHFRDCEKAYAE